MAVKTGIRRCNDIAADLPVTASVVLVTTGLNTPIGVSQRIHYKAYLPISVGAAGGVRAQVVVPAGGVAFNAEFQLNNTVAPSVTVAQQVASAAFTNALANAGNHTLLIEGTVVNGLTAGTLDIQFAQNTSDATPVTLFRGAWVEFTIL